ncbi:serine/threonine-protein kinase [Streptomyces sp. NPDC001728]|uniref:serine/threonine-protein kinase n=1 Tax=Streptomyces sp. NPDC001728 TaxID=3154396 RepID=UPI00332212A9
MTVIAGRYRLLDVLAEGATGTVWRALDETDGHEVALKEFRTPDGLPADEAPLLFARRERAARAAARISHPSAVRTLGVATEDGRPWVVTELVRGLTLAETLEAAGPLSPREAARVGAEVLGALRAAREAGVAHRGVGPGHVLLANDGRIVVTGFGTAPEDAPGPEGDLRALGELLKAAVGAPPSGGPVRRTPADDVRDALGALVEGLLHPDAERPLTADHVERELRRVAAGGTRVARAEPYATDGAGRTSTDGGAGNGRRARDGDEEDGERRAGAGGKASTPEAGATSSRRTGAPRRGPVLVAGLLGALLIAGALTYHLVVDDEGPDTGPGPGGATSTAPAGPGATDGVGGGSVTPRS